MQINEIPLGNGNHSKMAQRVLYNALIKKWQDENLGEYYQHIFFLLSKGFDIEAAIIEANFKVITSSALN
jgi:hypothetical protein